MSNFMVKMEDITSSKEDKIGQLAKEIFGKAINIDVNTTRCKGEIYIIKNAFMDYFFCNPKLILAITSFNNEFRLYNEKYLDRAKELANKYETNFGGEVTLKTDYSKR